MSATQGEKEKINWIEKKKKQCPSLSLYIFQKHKNKGTEFYVWALYKELGPPGADRNSLPKSGLN